MGSRLTVLGFSVSGLSGYMGSEVYREVIGYYGCHRVATRVWWGSAVWGLILSDCEDVLHIVSTQLRNWYCEACWKHYDSHWKCPLAFVTQETKTNVPDEN